MTSELRPAVEVWRDAMGVHHMAMKRWALTRECPNQAAAAVIEADREAVRAEMRKALIATGEAAAAHLKEAAKFKALAETLAGALEEWDELIKHPYFGSREAMSDMNYAAQRGLKALRQYKEARGAG